MYYLGAHIIHVIRKNKLFLTWRTQCSPEGVSCQLHRKRKHYKHSTAFPQLLEGWPPTWPQESPHVEAEHGRQRRKFVQGHPEGNQMSAPLSHRPGGQGLSRWEMGQGGAGPQLGGLAGPILRAGQGEEGTRGPGRREPEGGRSMQDRQSPNSQPGPSFRKPHPRTGHPRSVTLSHRDRTSCPSLSTCSLTGNKGMTLQWRNSSEA